MTSIFVLITQDAAIAHEVKRMCACLIAEPLQMLGKTLGAHSPVAFAAYVDATTGIATAAPGSLPAPPASFEAQLNLILERFLVSNSYAPNVDDLKMLRNAAASLRADTCVALFLKVR